MTKPKGVWLKTTELGEVTTAQVVAQQKTVITAKPRSRPEPRTKAGAKPERRLPVLITSLAVCSVALAALVSIHVYSAFASEGDAETDQTALNVNLYIDGEKQIIASAETTVAELLAAQGLYPDGNDIVEPALDSMIKDGQTIRFVSRQAVCIQADGHEYYADCFGKTVAEALHQVGVEVSALDEVSLPLDTIVEHDTIISVSRVYTKQIIETEEIAPHQDRIEDSSLGVGESKVLEEGQPGLRENILRITYRDGEEVGREIIDSQVLESPGVTMMAYGALTVASRGDAQAMTAGGASFNYTKAITVESTAYTWTGNRTATGTWPERGQIAVDPSVIPLGTKVYVEGYGFATATDTGGAIRGNIIDVYFDSYDECIQWGRKHNLTVYILE